MKKKLITLLVAVMALMGFQAKAIEVVIHTGDSLPREQVAPGGVQHGAYGTVDPWDNERGNYATVLEYLPNKLVWEGGTINDFRYRNNEPSTFNKAHRVTVRNVPSTNLITFSKMVDGNEVFLELPYGTTKYNQFVVFHSDGANAGAGFFDDRVLDYYSTDNAAAGDDDQVLVTQPFNAGQFEGWLCIQPTTGFVDAGDMLIVVHNKAGALRLLSYTEYVASLGPDPLVAATRDIERGANQYFPLYIKTELLSGRWARPSDFADCKFFQFLFSGDNLRAYDGDYLQGLSTDATQYDVFTVKQVDYVMNGDYSTDPADSRWDYTLDAPNAGYTPHYALTHNIITHYYNQPTLGGGARFQGINRDFLSTERPWYGTEYFGTAPRVNPIVNQEDSVIPLFVLGSPQDECKVLSVSRQNNQTVQTQEDIGFANQLELRNYGEYYYWFDPDDEWVSDVKTPSAVQGDWDDSIYDTYTSLQKFAIWIDYDGNFILYPAASYFWKYGEDKKTQDDLILPNGVLIYNDINVRFLNAVYSLEYSDKGWGLQIGHWNGRTTAGQQPEALTTIPNLIQTTSDYEERAFVPDCYEEKTDLSGRFYFLQVEPDTSGLRFDHPNWDSIPFRMGGYQYHRKYVLATHKDDEDFGAGGILIGKQLSAVVEEECRTTEPESWRLAFDSVNMAAHWEIQLVVVSGDTLGYRFINMLGDTLKYDPVRAAATAPWNLPEYLMDGAYQTVNGLIPGFPGAINGAKTKYFGRPVDLDVTPRFPWNNTYHWFDLNEKISTTATCDIWKVHQMKGEDSFFLELVGHPYAGEISLKFFTDDAAFPAAKYPGFHYNGWYNTIDVNVHATLGAGPRSPANPLGVKYYQQNAVLDYYDASVLINDSLGDFSTCGGMKITKKPIPYVPTYGPFYPGDKTSPDAGDNGTGIYNTNDQTWPFQKQDSLTAYTFLTGNYDIIEAEKVNNHLRLDIIPNTPTHDGTRTVDAAAFVENANDGMTVLEFVPIASPLGDLRRDSLKSLDTGPGWQLNDSIGWLYGETYKWYIVKTADNKYLSFDTINLGADVNRGKVGFVFDNLLTNAVPIRLYQPLVGDKRDNNFLFQFYMPRFTYYYDAAGVLHRSTVNEFPNVEVDNPGVVLHGGDHVYFATLMNQSNYIHATRAYDGTGGGTRFTFIAQEALTCPCLSEFITPQWLADERLLNLPLENQIWLGNDPVQAWIATGASTGTKMNSAIVANVGDEDKVTTLTHTYVASINDPGFAPGQVRIPRNSPATAWTTMTGFETDLEVPLYYIQNDEELYLTVVEKCDLQDENATVADVSGIKLEWRERYAYSATDSAARGYDRQALQLFAISGCEKDPIDEWYGKFVYLPLASFAWDYAENHIVNQTARPTYAALFPNYFLGKERTNAAGCTANDLTDCYRISYYMRVDDPVKHMVVFNANSTVVAGSITPIEFKVKPLEYLQPECDYYLVKSDKRSVAVDSGYYYTLNSMVEKANKNSLAAHWTIDYDAIGKAVFTPELEEVYGIPVDDPSLTAPRSKLMGEYYFVKELFGTKVGDDFVTLKIIDVSGYGSGVFTAVFDTITLSCVDHALPFFDLEVDGDFNIDGEKLAILETPYKDRNISYTDENNATEEILSGTDHIGWQTFIKQVLTDDFSDCTYLTVYKQNRRELTPNHIIPYYAFSITKHEVENGKWVDNEYFLTLDPTQIATKRSVYWTLIDDVQREYLSDPVTYWDQMQLFKFCLPYQVDEDGELVPEIEYGDTTYPPVYLQTLDLDFTDYPYLVIVGSASKYVIHRQLDEAIAAGASATLLWNIYTMDYRFIDPVKVTAWIFGGPMQQGNIWVPIQGLIEQLGNEAEGVLTDQHLAGGGVTFINESGSDPNYAVFTGLNNAPTLTLHFDGDTTIGNWLVRPIWYYRVQLGDNFLTDATVESGDTYYYDGKDYYLAEFTDFIDADARYEAQDITADENFSQSFGFRYVINDQDPDQAFWVVSNADYYTYPKAEQYRYLSEVNNHMVFVSNRDDALIFQWGKKIGDDYVNLEVIGKGDIYGVEGGIKLLNTTGKVDVYTIDGRLITSTVLNGNDTTIPASRGIAIVKNGSKVVKVVVK